MFVSIRLTKDSYPDPLSLDSSLPFPGPSQYFSVRHEVIVRWSFRVTEMYTDGIQPDPRRVVVGVSETLGLPSSSVINLIRRLLSLLHRPSPRILKTCHH